jgi:hypothetical protein
LVAGRYGELGGYGLPCLTKENLKETFRLNNQLLPECSQCNFKIYNKLEIVTFNTK